MSLMPSTPWGPMSSNRPTPVLPILPRRAYQSAINTTRFVVSPSTDRFAARPLLAVRPLRYPTVSLSDHFAERLICQHPLRILPHLCKGVARSKEFSYSCSLTLTRFMGFLQRIPFLRLYQSDSERSERSFVVQRQRSDSRRTVLYISLPTPVSASKGKSPKSSASIWSVTQRKSLALSPNFILSPSMMSSLPLYSLIHASYLSLSPCR